MKRRVLTILLFLLLVSGGAVVNIAVAWGIAAVHGWPRARYSLTQRQNETTFWSILEQYDLCVTYVTIIESSTSPVVRSNVGKVDSPDEIIPRWIYVQWRDHHRRDGRVRWLSVAFGWPCRSLCWHTSGWLLSDPEPPLRGGIGTGLPPVELGRIAAPRALPLLPIWPGFAINTLFYAVILWLIIRGPFVLRRLIRVKHGRCAKCGYDLRGDISGGCPECGWNREAEATA